MDFFSKKPSMDFFSKKTEGLRSSLTEGSSKLLDTAKESKTGLFGGLTSGISQISQRIGAQEQQNGTVPAAGATSAAPSTSSTQPPHPAAGGAGGMGAGGMGPGGMGPGGMGAMPRPQPGVMGGPQSTGNQLAPRGHDLAQGAGGNHPNTGIQQPMHSRNSPKQRVMKVHRDSDEIFEDSDADSQATEGADDLHMNDYDQANMDEDSMLRSGSMGSELSWASSDDHLLDDMSRDARDFMKNFVYKMFDPEGLGIDSVDKSRFGDLLQHEAGRLWFARYVNAQRAHKVVSEQTFYQLVQYFALVLFECNEAEDFVPAKTLMNMCFTFYYEDPPQGKNGAWCGTTCQKTDSQKSHQSAGPAYKHYLYSYLKDQPIWQSIRFWNAAFFDAVQKERMRRPLPTSRSADATAAEDKKFQENIVFGQLGTFTCNMRSFGLKKEMVQEFIRKQTSLAQLREGNGGMMMRDPAGQRRGGGGRGRRDPRKPNHSPSKRREPTREPSNLVKSEKHSPDTVSYDSRGKVYSSESSGYGSQRQSRTSSREDLSGREGRFRSSNSMTSMDYEPPEKSPNAHRRKLSAPSMDEPMRMTERYQRQKERDSFGRSEPTSPRRAGQRDPYGAMEQGRNKDPYSSGSTEQSRAKHEPEYTSPASQTSTTFTTEQHDITNPNRRYDPNDPILDQPSTRPSPFESDGTKSRSGRRSYPASREASPPHSPRRSGFPGANLDEMDPYGNIVSKGRSTSQNRKGRMSRDSSPERLHRRTLSQPSLPRTEREYEASNELTQESRTRSNTQLPTQSDYDSSSQNPQRPPTYGYGENQEQVEQINNITQSINAMSERYQANQQDPYQQTDMYQNQYDPSSQDGMSHPIADYQRPGVYGENQDPNFSQQQAGMFGQYPNTQYDPMYSNNPEAAIQQQMQHPDQTFAVNQYGIPTQYDQFGNPIILSEMEQQQLLQQQQQQQQQQQKQGAPHDQYPSQVGDMYGTSTSKDPYTSQASDMYGTNKDPYGTSKDPYTSQASDMYGTSKDPYTSQASDRYGTSKDPYTSQASDRYGTSKDAYTSQASDMYGTSKDPYTSQASDMYGTGKDPYTSQASDMYGTSKDPYTSQASDMYRQTKDPYNYMPSSSQGGPQQTAPVSSSSSQMDYAHVHATHSRRQSDGIHGGMRSSSSAAAAAAAAAAAMNDAQTQFDEVLCPRYQVPSHSRITQTPVAYTRSQVIQTQGPPINSRPTQTQHTMMMTQNTQTNNTTSPYGGGGAMGSGAMGYNPAPGEEYTMVIRDINVELRPRNSYPKKGK